MDCWRTPALLEAHREGSLSPDHEAALAGHLAACAGCRQEDELTAPLDLFSQLTSEPIPREVGQYLIGGLRVEEAAQVQRQPRLPRLASLRLAWLEPVPMLAALALAALLIVFWGVQGGAPSAAVGADLLARLEPLPAHAMTNAVATVEDIRSPTAEVYALSLFDDAGPTEVILIVDRSIDL